MPDFEIIRLPELSIEHRDAIIPALDALFFEASNTQDFASAGEKSTFRETWLGRYITHYPEHFYLSLSEPLGNGSELLGYLAGAPDNPLETPHFDDVEYFQLFKNQCAQYPAQLHINISANARGLGVGRALIDAYTTRCAVDGVIGCHVVTRAGADNIGFYQNCGFREIARAHWAAGERTLVFLGKSINQISDL